MKKRILLVLVLIIFFSAGCQRFGPGDNEGETAAITKYVRSGTTGLEMNWVANMPPNQLYSVADLNGVIELRNRGSFDIKSNKCFLQLGGFDSSIIRGILTRQTCDDIEGKNVYNTEGGFNQIDFRSSDISLPRDIDFYKPNLVATACYEYQTVASPQICVDPNFYEITSGQKACLVRDITLTGGQGAPVSVNVVDVSMVGSKVNFEIDIANVGGGKVLSPRTSLSQCPTSLGYDDLDEIRFTVELPSARLVKCTPNTFITRLTNDQGKIFCTFDVGNVPAYETPLKITLNYNYMSTVSKPIEIIRTPE